MKRLFLYTVALCVLSISAFARTPSEGTRPSSQAHDMHMPESMRMRPQDMPAGPCRDISMRIERECPENAPSSQTRTCLQMHSQAIEACSTPQSREKLNQMAQDPNHPCRRKMTELCGGGMEFMQKMARDPQPTMDCVARHKAQLQSFCNNGH